VNFNFSRIWRSI